MEMVRSGNTLIVIVDRKKEKDIVQYEQEQVSQYQKNKVQAREFCCRKKCSLPSMMKNGRVLPSCLRKCKKLKKLTRKKRKGRNSGASPDKKEKKLKKVEELKHALKELKAIE